MWSPETSPLLPQEKRCTLSLAMARSWERRDSQQRDSAEAGGADPTLLAGKKTEGLS